MYLIKHNAHSMLHVNIHTDWTLALLSVNEEMMSQENNVVKVTLCFALYLTASRAFIYQLAVCFPL